MKEDRSSSSSGSTLKIGSPRRLKKKEDIGPKRNLLLEKVQDMTDISDTLSSSSSRSGTMDETKNSTKKHKKRTTESKTLAKKNHR